MTFIIKSKTKFSFSPWLVTKFGIHEDDITRTRLGIQPEDPERICYYGAFQNTNIWKHSGTQYRVHSQV